MLPEARVAATVRDERVATTYGPAWAAAVAATLLGLVLWLGVAYAGGRNAPQAEPFIADAGVLTEWPMPPNTGPWNLKWDEARGLIWFSEGNHSDPPIDRLGALDPATSQLMEWGVPTAGGYVHGIGIDNSNNIWFSEVRLSKIGRLQPESNTITEWSLDPMAFAHGIAVDDLTPGSTVVWFSERGSDTVSSIDLATGIYLRHQHPFAHSWPHNTVIAPDHSVWFVETCGNRVGRLAPGSTDVWSLWQPPTASGFCSPPNSIGPLYGMLDENGDFWYSEPYNGNVVRLNPATNTFSIWRVPGAGGGAKLITQTAPDPDGNVFFTEMNSNRIGRLEPGGPTSPTVVVVQPTVVSRPAPPAATSVAVSVVWTPIVTQLTPRPTVLVGTRNGSFVEWTLPPISATPLRRVGPGRGWYGGGGFWISELTANKVAQFVPYTSTPGASSTPTSTSPMTFTPTATAIRTSTPILTATVAPSSTSIPPQPTDTSTRVPTSIPPSSTMIPPSRTSIVIATPSAVTCSLNFSDVPESHTFYTSVRCLACRGIISGYADGTFRPDNLVTRGQLAKIVSNAAGFNEDPGPQIFQDVPATHPFSEWINRLTVRGYMSGYTCGSPGESCIDNRPYFRPFANATRAQTSKIVSNVATYNDPPEGQTFEDVPPSHAFYEWIQGLASRGAMGGYNCGGPGEPCGPNSRPYFRPYNNVTRGQSAKIVANTFYPVCATPDTP